MSSSISLIAAVAVATLLVACPSATPRPNGMHDLAGGYPGVLRSPTALPGDYTWQQRVTAQWGPDGERRGFDAALEMNGEKMLLLGLTPMGTKAFYIVQIGLEVELHNESGHPIPFAPRYVMLDIQRVLFPWFEAGSSAPLDGTRETTVPDDRGGETVTERYLDGKLVERCFTRVVRPPEGEICVTYKGWEPGRVAARRAVLSNGWYGYRLEVETPHETRIDPQPPATPIDRGH